jgi:hydrogenase maturation protein HypF
MQRGLTGWVKNARDGVHIEVQGSEPSVSGFLQSLKTELPPPGAIEQLDSQAISDAASSGFEIIESDSAGHTVPVLPADLNTCADCRADVAEPSSRHHRYPFTSCALCGPRYAIATELPYDRDNTTMRGFVMCAACATEYGDIDDRRYHAQPIACPACGPQLALCDARGEVLAEGDAALSRAADHILAGDIVALRGLGGFQLLVDATNSMAVVRLRERKRRPHRAFAVMFGGLESASEQERALLESPASPIVLMARPEQSAIADEVAPDSPWVGAMLPYTPLHQLLMDAVARPCVCTSGNLSDEPMSIDLPEALSQLAAIADVWLSHDRPIARPVDDSVARVIGGTTQVLRRARGYAPLPVARLEQRSQVLALGAHLKSSAALLKDGRVLAGQHIGDLDSPAAQDRLEECASDLCRFFDAEPDAVACDLHPDYASTRIAERLAAGWSVPLVRVQHHHAHVAACIAEHGLSGSVLGLSWDGTGFGLDGTIWGGEALLCDGANVQRVGHITPFPLPGGDLAARTPWRSALGLLLATDSDIGMLKRWASAAELATVARAVERGVNAPTCSSMGRLFDAVAALTGLIGECSYEGQAAMMLEAQAMRATACEPYAIDTREMVSELLADVSAGVAMPTIAGRFHESLVELGVNFAKRARESRVVLSGGCFQNRLLHERLAARLSYEGFSVYTAVTVPPNDGGVAVGQAYVAAHSLLDSEDVSRYPR